MLSCCLIQVFESMKKQEETKQKSLVAKQAEYKALQAQAETVSLGMYAFKFMLCLFCGTD